MPTNYQPRNESSHKKTKPVSIYDTVVLADLDELILSCRSAAARGYMAEAVACYRAGAQRASIVATWTAVLFDFIDKLRELRWLGTPTRGRN